MGDPVTRVHLRVVEVLDRKLRIGLRVELKESSVYGVPVFIDSVHLEIALLEGEGEGERRAYAEFVRIIQYYSGYVLGTRKRAEKLQGTFFGRGVFIIWSDGIDTV
jgi:hypothetical protein